ncbi:MAG: prenyltransferase/squalene oxidase repeat-containing protein [Thermoguttaceae bacterium]
MPNDETLATLPAMKFTPLVTFFLFACCAAITAEEVSTDAIDTAVARGVAFLVSQQRDDGHLQSRGLYAGHAAVTSLAGLALLADDNTPTRGERAENVRRIVEALLRDAKPSGFIGDEATPHQAMYAHGYAVTFLAEVCGMNDRDFPQLRDVVARGVAIIVRTQNQQGGWRYTPKIVDDADISVTATQLVALRSAKNAGFAVPASTVRAATDYITRLQNDDGGFRYRISEHDSGFSRTAAAIVALQAAGDYDAEPVQRAFAYIAKSQTSDAKIEYETYGLFYAAIAIYCAGTHAPSEIDWKTWHETTVRKLVASQEPDGSWPSTTSREAETAMIVALLRLPKNRVASWQK